MRAKKQKHHAWLFILGGLLLAGCAADVGKTIKVSGEQATRYGALSAADAIAVLEKRVNEAKNAYMPFFAPNHFRGASEILSAAQKSADKKPKNELISDITKADAILDKGNAMMATVQTRLANELALKIQLDKDNVAKVYPKEYEKSVSELSSLIEKVELGKADNIDKDKIELSKKMQALDTRAIQYTALHESDVINEDTESNDGEDMAPVTFAETLRVYQDAMNRIAQSPHDKGIVQRAEADAMFAARHARNVNRRVIFLQKKYKKPGEAIVLDEEKRLLGISTALAHSDLRDRTLEIQAEEIAKAAGEIVQGQQKTKQAAGEVNDQSKTMEKNLKEANDALKKANAQLAEKDAQIAERDTSISGKDTQINTLREQIAQLEEQNKSLAEAKTAKPRTTKTQRTNPAK